MRKLVAALYPMKHISNAFVDKISGNQVSYYLQIDDKVVMAETKFSLFRVASNHAHQ